jgi:tetratricopeptide (TPR) repeat protein
LRWLATRATIGRGLDQEIAVRRNGVIVSAVLILGLAVAGPARTEGAADCFSDDTERRLAGCSRLIEMPDLGAELKSLAFAMRALARALKGHYQDALADYDQAIGLDPSSAIALNNRAWVYYRLKRPHEGLVDVERSLDLAPVSPHAHDTRAHIYQDIGRPAHALADYERAMRLGGERIVRLYQCGLQEHGLYTGRIDGLYSREVRRALEACVGDETCDPLPPDEECRNVTS